MCLSCVLLGVERFVSTIGPEKLGQGLEVKEYLRVLLFWISMLRLYIYIHIYATPPPHVPTLCA